MLETKITATELARNLSDVLSRIRYRGEQFVVERNGESIARIGPSSDVRGITLAELIARVGDLHMPGGGFADDLESIQGNQPKMEATEWPC